MLQWSNGAVWASTRVAPAGSVPSRLNSRWLPSIMQAASTSPATQRPGRVALAADVVAVQADADVEAAHRERPHRLEPGRTQMRQRQQRGLRRVDRADADGLARAGRRRSRMATVGAHDDHRGQVAIGVAHGQRPARWRPRASRQPPGAHPGQRRVPRHVDAAGEQVLDLALVVASTARSRTAKPWRGEPVAEAVPDRDDLGVVGDGAQSSTCRRVTGDDIVEQRQAAARRGR